MSKKPETAGVTISKKLVAVNTVSSVLSKLLQVSILVWAHQYLLRRISAEEYSLLPVVTSLMLIFPLFSTILISGISRFITEAVAKGDERRVVEIVSSVLPLLSGLMLMVLAAGAIMIWQLDSLLVIPAGRLVEARWMFGMLLVSFAATLPTAPYGAGFFVRQRYVLSNVVDLAIQTIRLSLLLGLLFLVSTSVIWIVVATFVSKMLGLSVRTWLSCRMLPSLRFRRKAFSWGVAREIASYGVWLSVAQIGGMIYRAIDPIMLNLWATPVAITAFSVGRMPLLIVMPFLSAATAPLFPVMVAMYATKRHDKLRSTFLRLGRYAAWFAGALVVPTIFYREEILSQYLGVKYEEYKVAGTVMFLYLAPMPLIHTLAHGLDKISASMGRMRQYIFIGLLAQIVNLLLTVLFLRVYGYGAIGSALATFISSVGQLPFLLWLSLRLTGIKLHSYIRHTLIPAGIPVIATVIATVSMRHIFVPQSWLGLGVSVAFGVVVSAGVSCCVAYLGDDRSDVKAIAGWIKCKLVYGK